MRNELKKRAEQKEHQRKREEGEDHDDHVMRHAVIVGRGSVCDASIHTADAIKAMQQLLSMDPEELNKQNAVGVCGQPSPRFVFANHTCWTPSSSTESSASQNGSTPLIIAAFNGNFKLVKFLLEQGADTTITDEVRRERFILAT